MPLSQGDLVLDIGSNDCTLLKFYSDDLFRVGIDPTIEKFKKLYPPQIRGISDLFPSQRLGPLIGDKKAKIVTSIAMFYDLESPQQFVREIHRLLADNGVWILEQSYFLSVLECAAYDVICHEHVEYYCLRQIKWLSDRLGFKIVDLQLNDVNGGSFCITLAKSEAPYPECTQLVRETLSRENDKDLASDYPYQAFKSKVASHRLKILEFLQHARAKGDKIIGYGASTKGNVILQHCGITPDLLPSIAEVNPDKFGCFTPATGIPIIPEEQARKARPDYFFVLPWHFKDNIIERERAFLEAGGKLVFPLPELEVIARTPLA